MGPCRDGGPLAPMSLLRGDIAERLSRGQQAEAGRAEGPRPTTPVVAGPRCASAPAVLKPTPGPSRAFE